MVEPVAAFLNGRGHRIVRARQVGLAADDDAVIAEYSLANDLVVVTFDYDLRSSVLRRGCRCLHAPPREATAGAGSPRRTTRSSPCSPEAATSSR
jgi:hypothetical protein